MEKLDVDLSILIALTPHGVGMSAAEIAEICSCTVKEIYKYEISGLRKIRRKVDFNEHI